jgi:hypothetical protein
MIPPGSGLATNLSRNACVFVYRYATPDDPPTAWIAQSQQRSPKDAFLSADGCNMKYLLIKHTVYLLVGAALFAGGVASSYLMYRCHEITLQFAGIIAGPVAQAEEARVMQVTFKKQVQAWKDILLRGKDDAALAKYTNEFMNLRGVVAQQTAQLREQTSDDATSQKLNQFAQASQLLNSQYDQALAGYRETRDFAQADKAMKGKDRPPTDLLDGVAERLHSVALEVSTAEVARLHHEATRLCQ